MSKFSKKDLEVILLESTMFKATRLSSLQKL